MPAYTDDMATIEERKNAQGKVTSYRVVWRVEGKKHQQSTSTLQGAQEWKKIIEAAGGDLERAEIALLKSTSDTPPVSEIAELHIGRLINVQSYTIRTYRSYVRNHLGTLGSIPVDRVTEDDMIDWIQWMISKGSSVKTIKNVHAFLSSAFDTAVRRRHRPDNPTNSKLLPKANATADKTTFLTMAEFATVESHLRHESRPLFRFLISTGLRLGEALALTPADIDLDGRVPSVRVTKAWKHGAGSSYVIGTPKTKRGTRTVALAPSTVELIRPLVEGLHPARHVFVPARAAQPPGYRQVQVDWKSAVKRSKISKTPRIHDLRHSHASMMIAAGMNLFELATRLGHENISTTTEVYGHLVPDAHFRAAELVEGAMTAAIES